MLINLKTETSPEAVDIHWVSDRLRWALGSYSAEIRTILVAFAAQGGGVACSIRACLRNRHSVEVDSLGRDCDDALRFGALRARAAVARKLETLRLLRGW